MLAVPRLTFSVFCLDWGEIWCSRQLHPSGRWPTLTCSSVQPFSALHRWPLLWQRCYSCRQFSVHCLVFWTLWSSFSWCSSCCLLPSTWLQSRSSEDWFAQPDVLLHCHECPREQEKGRPCLLALEPGRSFAYRHCSLTVWPSAMGKDCHRSLCV